MLLSLYVFFLVSKKIVFLSCVKIIRCKGKSIGCKMELPSKINNNGKSLKQGFSRSRNGDLITNRKFTALVVDSDPFIQILEKAILESQGVETKLICGKWDRCFRSISLWGKFRYHCHSLGTPKDEWS